MSSSGGEEQRRRRGGQHELAEVDDTLADIPALFSVTPPNVSGADSPSSLMMSPRTSQRNGSAAAVGNLEEDDGYKSSGEQTPDNSQTGRRSRESCSDGDSSTKEGDVTTTNITTMATAMASNTTVGGGKNSKRNSRGMSASVDSKRRTSGNTAAANPLNEASDDDEEDIRTELVENGNIEGTAREDDGMTANCCTPPYPRGSFFTTCSGREMSSSREMVSCAHCADHHPLPKDDCDLLHELTEQQRQQQQQQQLTVRRKSRKLSGSSLEEECLYCASLRRRRMMAMRKRPTVASGLLRASGSGATTVWNNNNNNDNNNSNNNNNNNNSVIKPAGRMVTSIGGHHLTILRDGMFMKESCSQREERFYEMLKPLQDYVWRHPELMDTLYSSLSSSSFSSSSDDNNNNNSDALEEKVSIRNSSYATMQRNWAQRRRLPKKNIRSVPCSIPSSNGSSISSADTAEDDSQRERRTAMAVCEGRHWDVLIPLIPFVPRFIGIRRVYVAKDGNVCKDGEWVSPVPKPQDGTLMGRSSALLASSGGGADRKEEADKKKIKDEDKNRGREEESKEMGEGEEVRQMIVMEDVCKGFVHPCILDIKMGSRQYGMNPSEAKLRSKEHKAALSTSMQYGVRLAGMKRWCPDTQQYETQSKIAGRHMSLDELREMVSRFTQSSKPLRHNFRKQVRHLRCTFMKQHVFRFFTSSLLFIYDADRPLMSSRVVMVDFAFTYEREELQRGGDPEAVYERDVGYIKALDTMLSILA